MTIGAGENPGLGSIATLKKTPIPVFREGTEKDQAGNQRLVWETPTTLTMQKKAPGEKNPRWDGGARYSKTEPQQGAPEKRILYIDMRGPDGSAYTLSQTVEGRSVSHDRTAAHVGLKLYKFVANKGQGESLVEVPGFGETKRDAQVNPNAQLDSWDPLRRAEEITKDWNSSISPGHSDLLNLMQKDLQSIIDQLPHFSFPVRGSVK